MRAASASPLRLQRHCAAFDCALLLCSVAVCAVTPAAAADRAPGKAAIASAHPLASEAGYEVLRAGGNAFDAAVAVSAALMVVEPSGSGFLGGGMYLLHRASDGRNVVIDAREKAPLAATRDMFLDKDGNPVRGMSINTALAAGIPGEPAGLALMQSRYGKLSLAQALKPAIRLASEGFDLYPRLQAGLRGKLPQLAKSKDAAEIWMRNGEVAPVGTRITQPQLARTLETLGREGVAAFYTGSIAKTTGCPRARDGRQSGRWRISPPTRRWSASPLSGTTVVPPSFPRRRRLRAASRWSKR